MRIEIGQTYCTLYREPGDKAISHESTVGYKMKLLVNQMLAVRTSIGWEFVPFPRGIMPVAETGDVTGGAFPVEDAVVTRLTKGEPMEWRPAHFVRMNPSKGGLTSCTLGLIDHKADVALWHERYAVEAAHQRSNTSGHVSFQRVDNVTREA